MIIILLEFVIYYDKKNHMEKKNIEFETYHSNKKRIYFFCGFVCVVVLLVVFIVSKSHAKYRVTQSIPLVNGTINYSLADLNIVSLYIDGVEAEELDSSKNYTLDTSKSTCTYKDGSTIDNLSISYDSETGGLSISPFTTKGTKCTLYFDEVVAVSDTLLANYPTKLTRTDFSTTVTNTTTGTIYYADTSKGRTYYFAGNPTDNWVQFGGFYWRIIRINEDGTIRLIYQGTSANTTGEGTQIGTSAFNSTYTNNMYVGYMYQSNGVHGLTSNSTIKGILDTWYQNNLTSVADKIDGNAGFCGDRQPSTSNSSSNGSGGTGITTTYYGAYIRLVNSNKQPTFECKNETDLYTTSGSEDGNGALTYPIGLISADEVAYAGGVYLSSNQSYYFYTGQIYWTMSPSSYLSFADVFLIQSGGFLYAGLYSTGFVAGIRPVINLKANVTIQSGDGSSSNPYVI